jgi:hypothetical protein
MAPARSSRRGAHASSVSQQQQQGPDFNNESQNVHKQIFLDPSFGLPLPIFIEKDVEEKELVCQLIQVCITPPSVPRNYMVWVLAKFNDIPETRRGSLDRIQSRSIHSWYVTVFLWCFLSL